MINLTPRIPHIGTWNLEPRGNLHPDVVKDFEHENGFYIHDWPHRYDVCDLSRLSQNGVKAHKSRGRSHKKRIEGVREKGEIGGKMKFLKISMYRFLPPHSSTPPIPHPPTSTPFSPFFILPPISPFFLPPSFVFGVWVFWAETIWHFCLGD